MAKVLGMGNALVDIMTMLPDDSILSRFNLPKGSMQLVDRDFSDIINNATEHVTKQIASGGSAANTIHGLASMDVETAFIGKVGKDKFGSFFSDDMKRNHIIPIILQGTQSTGKAIALISPDSERTFATYLGAAVELSPDDISEDLFNGYDYFHIEGYLVQNHALIEKAVKLARQKDLKISLDMASYNVVDQNLEFLKWILKDYVDIVFANEEEAKAFSGKIPDDAVTEFSEHCGIAVVKTGKSGSLVMSGKDKHSVNAIKANSIDTTGAGDLYAAGFIYGLINKFPLEKCGVLGSVLAGKTIEIIGPKMNSEHWAEVKRIIRNL
ncbi:MAG: adenosine kinase [Bacteroidetes bacterium]|nr:adenosine kinase [Bacteroidota bacterium]